MPPKSAGDKLGSTVRSRQVVEKFKDQSHHAPGQAKPVLLDKRHPDREAIVQNNLERRQLLHHVQEQDGVIQKLWEQYTRDVGKPPDMGEIIGRNDRYVPAKKQLVLNALNREPTFEEAVEMFDFKLTHRYAEMQAQRVASRLMHGRKPAVVAREAGDVILEGFWGKGVSMPVFEKLLAKLRGIKHGSFRRVSFSDNGLNGNFVPGIIDILRRGVHRLDLSQNSIESAPMQQLCNALPSIGQYLEVLDIRFNPCASDPAFVFALADIVPSMKFLTALSVTVRCADKAASIEPSFTPTPARARSASRGRSGPKQQRSRRSPSPGLRSSWRVHDMSNNKASVDGVGWGSEMGPSRIAARDSTVALLRGIAESPQLRMLDLRSSLLSRAAVQRLAYIVRGDQLTHLGLGDCFLGNDMEPILGVIGTCRNLVYVNLRLNSLTDRMGIELCQALDESISITELDVGSNELGDAFGKEFSDVLRRNEVLWKVDLTRNLLTATSGESLLQAVSQKNSTLVSVGDTADALFGLGLQTRYQLQCQLEANEKAMMPGHVPDLKRVDPTPSASRFVPMTAKTAQTRWSQQGALNPELADLEFTFLDDEPDVPTPWTILM